MTSQHCQEQLHGGFAEDNFGLGNRGEGGHTKLSDGDIIEPYNAQLLRYLNPHRTTIGECPERNAVVVTKECRRLSVINSTRQFIADTQVIIKARAEVGYKRSG